MRTDCKFRDAVYEQFARVGKAVSSPKRLELLDLLAQGERTVEVLAKESDLSIANASQHLHVLRAAGLVEAEKHGLYVTYRLADDEVWEFVCKMKGLAEHRLAEIEQMTRRFREAHPDLTPMDRDALKEHMRMGDVTLLDVRPREEYRAGHIPGAICVPLDELDVYLDKLSEGRDVVAYCRGRYCVLAAEAAERLRAEGFGAYQLEDSVRDWQAAGNEIER